jgi:hypothetical protein
LENLDIDGKIRKSRRIVLILIFKMNLQEVEWKVKDWIEPTLDGDRCQALVNVVMSCWVL